MLAQPACQISQFVAVLAADIGSIDEHAHAARGRSADRGTADHGAACRPRAPPATQTGVSGRPTRARALSPESEMPILSGEHSTDPRTPPTITAAASNARFKPMHFITLLP